MMSELPLAAGPTSSKINFRGSVVKSAIQRDDMRSSHRSGGEPDANPGAHRSDAACPRGICRTPAIPLHGTAFEERMDYRTRNDVRRHFRKRGATPSHLCPNARVAGIRHRPRFKASRNIGLSATDFARGERPRSMRVHRASSLDGLNGVSYRGVDRPAYAHCEVFAF